MKKLTIILSTFLCAVLALPSISQAKLYRTYAEFKARYNQVAVNPEGAVNMYFDAVFSYFDPSNRSEASKMLRYSLASEIPIESSRNLATFMERLKDPNYHHIFRSFCEGTSPENDYEADLNNYSLKITSSRTVGKDLRMMLRSTGADSTRPVLLRKYGSLWHVVNNSSTYVGVRTPKSFEEARIRRFDADNDPVPSPNSPKNNHSAQSPFDADADARNAAAPSPKSDDGGNWSLE